LVNFWEIFAKKWGNYFKLSKKRKNILVKIPTFLKRGKALNNFTTSMGLYK
jgi:hypothetical protein